MKITNISENGGIKLLIKQITESFDIKELLVFMKKINNFGQGLHQIKVRYFNHLVYKACPSDTLGGFFIVVGNENINSKPSYYLNDIQKLIFLLLVLLDIYSPIFYNVRSSLT